MTNPGSGILLAQLQALVVRLGEVITMQRNGIVDSRAASARKQELRREILAVPVAHLAEIGALAAPEVPELGKAFPDRQMRQVHAAASPAEETAFDALVDLKFSAIDQRRHGAMLFKTTLEKALFSSPAACRQTIAERIKTIGARKDAADFAHDVERLPALDDRVAEIEASRSAGSASIRAFSAAMNSSRPSIWASCRSYSDMPSVAPRASRCSATIRSRVAIRVSSSRMFGLVSE